LVVLAIRDLVLPDPEWADLCLQLCPRRSSKQRGLIFAFVEAAAIDSHHGDRLPNRPLIIVGQSFRREGSGDLHHNARRCESEAPSASVKAIACREHKSPPEEPR
ncbi:MAG: hypothetical protein ACK56I_25415, partial [bacterium]